MKMSDVKVGMRLRSILMGGNTCGDITVTEITERGFKYRIDASVCVHPRLGITINAEGHEHWGYGDEALYEPVPIAADALGSFPLASPCES